MMFQQYYVKSTRFGGYTFLRFLLLLGGIFSLTAQPLFAQSVLPYTLDANGVEDLSTMAAWPQVPSDYSGITYRPDGSSGRLFVVDNKKNDVYEYEPDGSPVRRIDTPFSAVTDAEGITWLYGNQFAIADEDSSKLFIVMINNGQMSSTYSTIQTPVPVDGGFGLEGVSIVPSTANSTNQVFFVVREGDPNSASTPPMLYKFTYNTSTDSVSTTWSYNLSSKMIDAAGVYYNELENAVYIMSDESKKVVKYELTAGTDNTPVFAAELALTGNSNFTQPEGISMTPDGLELFVVGEAARQYGRFVKDNTCPQIDPIDDITVALNGSVSITPTATDLENDALTWSADSLPSGLIIDQTSGTVSGTALNSSTDSITIHVSENGNPSCADSASFTLTVEPPVNTPPVIDPVDDQHDYIKEYSNSVLIELDVTATDADSHTLSWTVTGLPTGVSYQVLDTEGYEIRISGSPIAEGNYSITVTVDDGHGGTDTIDVMWHITRNIAPVFEQFVDLSSQVDVALPISGISLAATDPDAGTPYPLAYGVVGNYPLPPGLTLASNTGLVTGTPTQTGAYDVRIVANDGINGPVLSNHFTWTIVAPDTNHPPVIDPIGDQYGYVGEISGYHLIQLDVTASDADWDTLSWAVTGLPTGVSYQGLDTDGYEIRIEGIPTAVGNYLIEVSVDDGNGGTATEEFTWHLTLNQAPVWDYGIPSSRNAVVGYDLTNGIPFTATDPEGDPLTYSATDLPDGLDIDANTSIVSGIPTTIGTYNTIISVSDGYSIVEQSFPWHILPIDQCPEIETSTVDVSSYVGDIISNTLTALDPEGNDLVWSANNLPAGLSLNGWTGELSGELTTAGVYTVTLSVWETNGPANQCGFANATTESLVWTVLEVEVNNPPQLAPIANQTNTYGQPNISLWLNASDIDGDTLQWVAQGLPRGLKLYVGNDSHSAEIRGSIGRQYGRFSPLITVSDGKGGQATARFAWIIKNPREQTPIRNAEVDEDSTGGIYLPFVTR